MTDPQQPDSAFLQSIDIHELLPQQEPFVMISRLVHFNRVRTTTETDVYADNIFVEGGHLSAPGLIENIAQTCAARIGYYNKYILKKGIQIGFIGAVRNMVISALPKVGDTIITNVDVKEELFGMILAEANVICKDKQLVTAEMKIALKDEREE